MDFLKNENGDTNFVSIVIVLGVAISGVLIFRPYLLKFAEWIISSIS